MISGYNAIASGGDGGYTIKLKSPNRAFSEITISTDGSFMLKRASLKNKNGDMLSFSLNLLDSTGSVSAGTFNFSVPSNAQVINNPLDIK
jgi:outer membrane lipoprotein carrier protein